MPKIGQIFIGILLLSLNLHAQEVETLTVQSAKDCKAYLEYDKTNFGITAATAALSPFGGVAVGIATSSVGVGLVAVLGLVTVTATGEVIHNIRRNRVIHLIEQAEIYVQTQNFPGKLLRKMHQKLQEQTPEVSMLDLAESIVRANVDKTLCQSEFRSVRELTRDFKGVHHVY